MTQTQKLKNYKPLDRATCLAAIKPEQLKRWQEFKQTQVDLKTSGAIPLPGAAGKAFPAKLVQVKQFTVRPVKAADWVVLQKMGSPLIEQAMEATKEKADQKEVKIGMEDMMVAVYLLTRPAREVYEELAKIGPDGVKMSALIQVGETVPVELMGEMFAASQGQVEQSFSTTLQYGADAPDGEKKSISQG